MGAATLRGKVGTAGSGASRWWADGVCPTMVLKVRVNSEKLPNPTYVHTVDTDKSVSRSSADDWDRGGLGASRGLTCRFDQYWGAIHGRIDAGGGERAQIAWDHPARQGA